jgi:hypothetical protein
MLNFDGGAPWNTDHKKMEDNMKISCDYVNWTEVAQDLLLPGMKLWNYYSITSHFSPVIVFHLFQDLNMATLY